MHAVGASCQHSTWCCQPVGCVFRPCTQLPSSLLCCSVMGSMLSMLHRCCIGPGRLLAMHQWVLRPGRQRPVCACCFVVALLCGAVQPGGLGWELRQHALQQPHPWVGVGVCGATSEAGLLGQSECGGCVHACSMCGAQCCQSAFVWGGSCW